MGRGPVTPQTSLGCHYLWHCQRKPALEMLGGVSSGLGDVMTVQSNIRESVKCAQHRLRQAATAGRPIDVHRHAARLLELLDRARGEGIDAINSTASGTSAGHENPETTSRT